MNGGLAVLAGLTVAALTACAHTDLYAPLGGEKSRNFGYRETRTGDGRYTLLVITPAISEPTLAFEYWDRRAGELCGTASFRKNIFRAERPTVRYDYYGGRPGDFVLEGYLDCMPPEAEGRTQ